MPCSDGSGRRLHDCSPEEIAHPSSGTALVPALPTLPEVRFTEESRTMPGRFANQVAVITGASSGIGWSLAKVLAGEGARVGLVARRQDRLDALVGEIRQANGIAEAAAADVGDREETLRAIRYLGNS